MNLNQAPVVYILVDNSKMVQNLGEKCPVPVECYMDKVEYVANELKKLGAVECKIRKQKNTEENYITENCKYIIDARFKKITEDTEKKINKIDGVLENGLFIGYNNVEVISCQK